MTLEQFRYVIEVERTGSINKAAANLYMTQSALSLSILNLEKELGSTIFARTKKGTVLTPFGKTLLQYLRPLHEQIEQVNKLFVQGKARDNMTLKIANDGFTVASLICSMLYDKYRPVGLRIEHFDSSGDQARSMVADHMAEIGIIRIWNCYEKIEMRQLDTLGLAFHPLIEGSLAVAVGMGSPLYHDKSIEYVTPDMLQKYPAFSRVPLSAGSIYTGIPYMPAHSLSPKTWSKCDCVSSILTGLSPLSAMKSLSMSRSSGI